MTLHTHFENGDQVSGTPGEPRKPQTPEVDHKKLRQLSLTQGAAAAQAFAGSLADRLNAGLRARTEANLAAVKTKIGHIEADIAQFRAVIEERGGVFYRRTNKAAANVGLTAWERVQNAVYICLTVVALVVAVSVVAAIMQEYAPSAALAGNLWLALGYAFPIVLASSGLAAYLTIRDDEAEMETRISRLLMTAGIVFVAWLALTGLETLGRSGGFAGSDDIFATSLDAPVVGASYDGVTWFYGLVGALFPQTLTGMVLLVMHVLSDVMLAAALTARVILMDRKTREIEAYECPKALKAQTRVAELELAKRMQVGVMAQHTDTLAEIDAIRANLIADVALGTSVEERRAEATRANAEARTNLELAEEAL